MPDMQHSRKHQVKAHARSNADAVVQQGDGTLLFVEPYEQHERFTEFLDYIQEDSNLSSGNQRKRVVKYAQTRELNDLM